MPIPRQLDYRNGIAVALQSDLIEDVAVDDRDEYEMSSREIGCTCETGNSMRPTDGMT